MKFSIVTPSRNCEKYIAETMDSVLSQKGDFEIEYIVMDGASTDRTFEIVKAYERRMAEGACPTVCAKVTFRSKSEPDGGMYDAINKGFAMADGDVFAYLNSDDVYLPGALQSVAGVFKNFPEIQWLKGITSYIGEDSRITSRGKCYLYDRDWIRRGVYGREAYFIQQESVFWRAALWHKAAPIDIRYDLAGDYYLWTRFAAFADLVSMKREVSCFRDHPGQLSKNFSVYMEQVKQISGRRLIPSRLSAALFYREALLPHSLWRRLYGALFPGHRFSYIDFRADGKPELKKSNFYLP